MRVTRWYVVKKNKLVNDQNQVIQLGYSGYTKLYTSPAIARRFHTIGERRTPHTVWNPETRASEPTGLVWVHTSTLRTVELDLS